MNEYQNRRKNIAVQRYFLRILAGMCLAGIVLFLGGCQIVEPEKRAYPLVIGLDKRSEEYQVSLGMASLAVSTGQEKEGSNPKLWMNTIGPGNCIWIPVMCRWLYLVKSL